MAIRTRNLSIRSMASMVAVVLGAGLLLAGSASATPAEPDSDVQPAGSSGLTTTLDAPTQATAGSPYSAAISWQDTSGDLIAAVSSWGDTGIGWSTPPSCESDAVTSGASAGTETFDHVWSEPGTYTVDLSVTTGGCGTADETESVSFTVTVS